MTGTTVFTVRLAATVRAATKLSATKLASTAMAASPTSAPELASPVMATSLLPATRLATVVLMATILATSLLAATAPPASAQTLDRPLVHIETSLGTIVAELYPEAAPVTVRNFLAYVADEVFDGGSFFRSVRLDNQPDDSVRIEVIQGGPARAMRDRMRDAIALERTSVTGLSHLNGTLSMARSGPDTGRSQFFVCIGPQPSLDYGGARNPDGQGFAAFGRVVEGMEVVRAIQGGAVERQTLVEPVTILTIREVGVSLATPPPVYSREAATNGSRLNSLLPGG